MKTLVISVFGSLGLWIATDLFAVAFQIIIGVITVVALLYEKNFFRKSCVDCRFYKYYVNNEKKREKESGDKK